MNPPTETLICVFLLLFAAGCRTIASEQYIGKVYTAVLVDQVSGNAIIGQTIHEYDRVTNSTLTDTSGKFSLSFVGIIPVIVVTGYYEPLMIIVDPSRSGVDTIPIGSYQPGEVRSITRKASNSLARSRAFFSLPSTWVIDSTIVNLNSHMRHYEEYEPRFREQQLRRLMPRRISTGDTVNFKQDGWVNTDKNILYRFESNGEYFSLYEGDAVYLFSWYLINPGLMTWIRDDEFGSIEYRFRLL